MMDIFVLLMFLGYYLLILLGIIKEVLYISIVRFKMDIIEVAEDDMSFESLV